MGDFLELAAELFGLAAGLAGFGLALLCLLAVLGPVLLIVKLFDRVLDGPAKDNDKRAADDPANPN